MTIAPLGPADLDDVVAVARDAFAAPWTREAFAAELSRELAMSRALRVDGSLVAYVIAWALGGELEILSIATAVSAQRRGHARHLLASLLDEARARGVTRAFLEVRADNMAAIALYRSLGFRDAGRRAGYYADDTDAVLMAWAPAT